MAIRKIKNKYFIFSKTTGRRLSKGYSSRKDALKRLREIEFFKHNPGK